MPAMGDGGVSACVPRSIGESHEPPARMGGTPDCGGRNTGRDAERLESDAEHAGKGAEQAGGDAKPTRGVAGCTE